MFHAFHKHTISQGHNSALDCPFKRFTHLCLQSFSCWVLRVYCHFPQALQ
jgi:hypothetical protein